MTEKGAQVAEESQKIVDGVHERALGSLPQDEREVLLRAMKRLVDGHLATPSDSPQTVRRARQRG